MAYEIRYKTKKGGSGMMSATTSEQVKAMINRCFREKRDCRVEKDGVVIGETYKSPDTGKWCWYLDTGA